MDELIEYLTDSELPFSSGELAACIRTHRPDLRFSVTKLGEEVRDKFYSGAITYPDPFQGPDIVAIQVPRTTQGIGRTPPGQSVFVYAPDQLAGEDHEFEIDIPLPGGAAPQPTTAPVAPAAPAPAPQKVAGIQGVPSNVELRATVHKDGRLCITRSAFEKLVHAVGKPVAYGTDVFTRFEDNGDKAFVSLDPNSGGQKHELTRRGRILFPRIANPLTAGSVYKVEVHDNELVIDLTIDLKKVVGGN
jgi:hypothetical protein